MPSEATRLRIRHLDDAIADVAHAARILASNVTRDAGALRVDGDDLANLREALDAWTAATNALLAQVHADAAPEEAP